METLNYMPILPQHLMEHLVRDKLVLCPSYPKLLISLARMDIKTTRVVVLGQDPYHTPGKANGLAFGVDANYTGNPLDGSLGNIAKEVLACGYVLRDFTLHSWASQGVLLLNTILSTRQGEPLAHKDIGWEEVVAEILSNLPKSSVIWLAWGRHAQGVAKVYARPDDHVLVASHPSPLGASRTSNPFLGCKHFSKVNEILRVKPIIWGDLVGHPTTGVQHE